MSLDTLAQKNLIAMFKFCKISIKKSNVLNIKLVKSFGKNSLKVAKKSDSASRLTVLSNGYGNTPKSCMLIFDSSRYLINSGEGILRLILSNNLRPSKITNILLTRFDWSCTGGLNGLSKELEDHKHQVILHSDHNFEFNSKLSIKKYFFEKKFNIKQHFHSHTEYSDENVIIKQIDIKQSACSYLVTIKKSEPNLNMEKLAKFEVKPGPWIRDLKNGIEYNKDNIVIKPEDVLDFSLCSEKKILFIDCVDKESFDLMQNSTEFNRDDLLMIIHLGNSDILNSKFYLDWIKNYPSKDCIHLFLDENYPNIDLVKIYETQAQLNLIDSTMFQYLPAQQDSFKNLQSLWAEKTRQIQKEAKIVQAQSNMIFFIKPDFRLDLNSMTNNIDNMAAKEKILSYYQNDLKYKIDGIDQEEEKILQNIRLKMSNDVNRCEINEQKYPSILFLGTASSLPATTRNLTSILIQSNENVNILLDCGEATIGQINKKFLDKEKFWNQLTKIKLVFISHFHLDHFNGLYGLVSGRIKAFQALGRPYEKLNVIYPRPLMNFLSGGVLVLKDFFNHVNLIPNDKFLNQPRTDFENFSLKSVETVLVKHIYHSYGISLGLLRKDGTVFKLVYSGDCRPSDALVNVGKNCDLLIHECTFDDAFKDEALNKMHSTISEALVISDQMQAKSTILTHFSLRYGKITQIDEIKRDNVGIAFDFMNITEDNFEILNKILKEVRVIFKEHVDEIEVKRSKKLKL